LNFKYLKEKDWNIYDNHDDELFVALLQGSDGKEDHCVTIFGKWIFDSNIGNALTLDKKSLDYCCSSDDTIDSFVKVVKVIQCTNYKEWLSSKKRQAKRKRGVKK